MKIKTEKLATENTEITERTGGRSTIRGVPIRSGKIKNVGERAARCGATAFSVISVFSVAKRSF
jgi:hypothetical protein